jgi:hypothetical protein
MAAHENPQRPAKVFYPAGHPKHEQQRVNPEPPTGSASDLGDVIRGIGELASELHEVFFSVPDIADSAGRVDPERFDAATQQAFIACGNALDYAVRLVSEKRSKLRMIQLRKELAEEMRALGMTGEPLGEPPSPPAPPQVG